LQSFLDLNDYDPGPKDGVWGVSSNKALCRFLNDKQYCFVYVDGSWGTQTTFALQAFLSKKGFKLAIDGRFGKQTIRALQAFLNS
jgi:peptidoglycan hydrolase-like protein with peptidoglycan-binding domain